MNKRGKIILFSILGVLLAAALAAVLLLVFGGKSVPDTPGTTDPAVSESAAPEVSPEATPELTPDPSPNVTDDTPVDDGSEDPEIKKTPEEEGADVKAEELTVETGRSNGIDVSKWQGKIDWQKVKASGIEFAFIRIGYRGEDGKLYKDANADYNIQQAQKAGVLVGVYFFSTAVNETEALEEANWTLNAIEGYSISYPVVYDCEGYKSSGSRMNGLSAAQRTKNAVTFLNAVKNAGYDAMFYAPRNDVLTSEYWDMTQIASKYKVWIAQYPAVTYPAKDKPDYSGVCHAWQYTDKGTVPGIDGGVDMVVCYFTCSLAQPKNASAAPGEATAPLTQEEKIYTKVNESVTAKELTNLRTAATTNSEVVAALKNGEVLTRIAVGSNGWSKLSYNGQTVYAVSSFLTTDLTPKPTSTPSPAPTPDPNVVSGQTFASANDQVTAKIEVNLRTEPTTNSETVASLKNGEFLTRTGIGDKGWSRLDYQGQTVYAVTSYLTTETASTEPEGEASTSQPVSDGFRAVNEQVTAKSETNLRTAPSTANSEVVYTLKNGEFIQRVGVHDNGWSKLLYNGQTVYAISSYLTTEVTEAPAASEESAPAE